MVYSKLLEAQIKKSNEFSRTTFGKMVGEDYPDFLKDATDSESAAGMAMVGSLAMIMLGQDIPKREKEKELRTGKKSNATELIKENLPVFDTYFQFLYWGIQIGKEIAKNDNEVSALEKMVGL